MLLDFGAIVTAVSAGLITEWLMREKAPRPKDATGTTTERDQDIIDAVVNGDAIVEWSEVTSTDGTNTLTIPVMRRALALPNDPNLIVSMSFDAAQKIADELDAYMLTSKVSDLIEQQANVRIAPITHPEWVEAQTMATTENMVKQSELINLAVGDAGGLVSGEGKQWVVTRRNWPPPEGTGVDLPEGERGSMHNGANYGLYSKSASSTGPGGLKVWQSIGLAHERLYVDYSQLLVLMGRHGKLNGETVDLADVAAHPEGWYLISDEGPLPALRHPDL